MIIEIQSEAIRKMLVEMANAEKRTVDAVAEGMLRQFFLAWNSGAMYGLNGYEAKLIAAGYDFPFLPPILPVAEK